MALSTPFGQRSLRASLDLDGLRLDAIGRRRSDRAVERFWEWWHGGGSAESEAAVCAGDAASVVPEITSLIEAIDPGLAWEFGPGRDGSQHTLTVTAAGVPELRGAARRWLSQAPEDDLVWAFADLREPVAGTAMFFRGYRIAFDEAAVIADMGLSLVDVRVHHPVLDCLGAHDRGVASYLLLDAVVGEAAVETWVGKITADSGPAPRAAMPLADLRALLDQLAADNVDEDGSPAWQILQGDGPDGPMIAMVRTPLVALSAPHYDRHVALSIPYTDIEDCGLPGPGSLAQLRDLEDHLTARVMGSAECVGAESCNGRRTLHFYADSSTPAAEQLRVAASGWEQGPVVITDSDDPGWSRVQHLRV